MHWLPATVTALAVVAAFWLPGGAVLTAWGWRAPPLLWVAAAPVVSLGVLGLGAVALQPVLPWGLGAACVAVAVVSIPPLAWRVARSAWQAARPRVVGGEPRALVGVTVAAVLVPLAAVVIGMGRPDRFLVAYDVLVHQAGLTHIRAAGTGSSMVFNSVNSLSGQSDGFFYGAAWHDVASLVPPWPDASVAFNLALVLPTAICWTTGVVALTRAAFPARPRAHVWAAGLSASGLAYPVLLALRPEGMVPNAMGVAVLPVTVVLIASALRRPRPATAAVAAVAFAGLGLTHPNAAIACALVLLPLALGTALRVAKHLVRRARSRRRAMWLGALAAVGALGLVAIAVSAFERNATFSRVAQVAPDPPLAPYMALLQAVSGNATGMGNASGFVVGIAAIVGIVVAWRVRPARWALGGCLVAFAWYLAATSSVPGLTDIDRPWYGETKRFAPVLAAMLVPPAAVAIDAFSRRLRVTLRAEGRRPAIATVLVGALVAVPAMVGASGLLALARYTYQPTAAEGQIADDAELAMMRRLPGELDPRGAVLGSPFAGAAQLGTITGLTVVPPTMNVVFTPDLTYVAEHLGALGTDPRLCAALAGLGVRYLYVDPAPSDALAGMVNVPVEPTQGVRRVDQGGGAVVDEITAC